MSSSEAAYAKLEALKEIRGKTIGLEKLRVRLLNDVEAAENEDKCMAEFRREMELLQQEKMAHVEELRQIHADMQALETVMKQADEARRQSRESARRLIEDYAPLKQNIDFMREELLGLEKLPELPADDKERLIAMGVVNPAKAPKPQQDRQQHQLHLLRQQQQNAFLQSAQHSAMGFNVPQFKAAEQLRASSVRSGAFHQQPPPMKKCQSCHQEIHRNAPICPMCKAKARSRNPKKPKKH